MDGILEILVGRGVKDPGNPGRRGVFCLGNPDRRGSWASGNSGERAGLKRPHPSGGCGFFLE